MEYFDQLLASRPPDGWPREDMPVEHASPAPANTTRRRRPSTTSATRGPVGIECSLPNGDRDDFLPVDRGKHQPSTAQAAHDASNLDAATLRDRAYQALRYGPKTADQVAEVLGESILAVRPRISELAAAGLVCDSGERAVNASGHSAIVWRIV
jgi:hypothetical protein